MPSALPLNWSYPIRPFGIAAKRLVRASTHPTV